MGTVCFLLVSRDNPNRFGDVMTLLLNINLFIPPRFRAVGLLAVDQPIGTCGRRRARRRC